MAEAPDVLPRGGEVGADGEVFGVLEEALAGGASVVPSGVVATAVPAVVA